jgi:hypothetical protein
MYGQLWNGDEKVETSTYCFCCSSALVCCDFLDCALDLYEVDILVPQLDYSFENGLDLHNAHN